MVVFLVALTFVAVILLEGWVTYRRRRAVQAALARPGPQVPARLELLHPGHTWAVPLDRRIVAVGSSGFAAGFAGDLATVEAPPVGTRLRQGEPAWTLVSRGGRQVTQVAPLDGKVLAVNPELARDPHVVRRGGRSGWVLCLRPRHLRDRVRNLLQGPGVAAWEDFTRNRLHARTGSLVGAVAQDGGTWLPDFGERLDDETWLALRRELFPVDSTAFLR
jgi:glycine cleavage system H lipoate-binding protein